MPGWWGAPTIWSMSPVSLCPNHWDFACCKQWGRAKWLLFGSTWWAPPPRLFLRATTPVIPSSAWCQGRTDGVLGRPPLQLQEVLIICAEERCVFFCLLLLIASDKCPICGHLHGLIWNSLWIFLSSLTLSATRKFSHDGKKKLSVSHGHGALFVPTCLFL